MYHDIHRMAFGKSFTLGTKSYPTHSVFSTLIALAGGAEGIFGNKPVL